MVEVRHYWRRDAVMGEAGSRSRHPYLLANLALRRSALLAVLASAWATQSPPQIHQQCQSHPARALALLAQS